MPGLQFQDLPAAQTQKIRETLTAQWQIEADALSKSWFSDRGKFETAKAKLNAKYKQMELQEFTQLQQQFEEQQRVQTLIRQPRERTRGQEAQLRMELGPEAERLVFPVEKSRDRPFSPGQLISYIEFMEPFIKRTKTSGWGITGYKREQQDLVKQYLAARDQAGYDDPRWTPKQKRQFDTDWDYLMTTDRDFEWDPEAPEIKSLRAVGRLTRAVVKNITPLGASVAKKKRFTIPTEPMTFGIKVAQRMVSPRRPEEKPTARYAQNPDTGERIISRDGGRTWQKAQ